MIWVCSEVFEKAVLGSEGAGCWGVIGCDQGMDGGVFCNDEKKIDWGRCLFRQSIRHTQCFVCECFLYSSCLSLCVCVYPSYAEMDASPMYIDVLG